MAWFWIPGQMSPEVQNRGPKQEPVNLQNGLMSSKHLQRTGLVLPAFKDVYRTGWFSIVCSFQLKSCHTSWVSIFSGKREVIMTIIVWSLPFRPFLMTSYLSGLEMTGVLVSFGSAGGCEYDANTLHCNCVPINLSFDVKLFVNINFAHTWIAPKCPIPPWKSIWVLSVGRKLCREGNQHT